MKGIKRWWCWHGETVWFICIFLLLMAGVFGLALGLTAVCLRADFQPHAAAIEQLRSDALNVNGNNAEAVAGMVAKTNQSIKQNQKYNQMWWSDWMVPDGWNHIELIEMPDRKGGE